MTEQKRSAVHLDWSRFRHFSPDEWPADTLEHMDPAVIVVQSEIRNALPSGYHMVPSPVPRGHVRHEEGGSRHSTNGHARLSDATDTFVAWSHVWAAWSAALRNPRVGGLGLYTDMQWAGQVGRRAMLHIDTRRERVVWVAWREHAKAPMHYVYLHSDPIGFFRTMAQRARSE